MSFKILKHISVADYELNDKVLMTVGLLGFKEKLNKCIKIKSFYS